MRNIHPVTPGELLKKEFLEPMGISKYRLVSNGYWLRAQAAYDTEVAEFVLAEQLVNIRP